LKQDKRRKKSQTNLQTKRGPTPKKGRQKKVVRPKESTADQWGAKVSVVLEKKKKDNCRRSTHLKKEGEPSVSIRRHTKTYRALTEEDNSEVS